MQLILRRTDGTYVALVNNLPYHVIPSDERYWKEAVRQAEELGNELPTEPSDKYEPYNPEDKSDE